MNRDRNNIVLGLIFIVLGIIFLANTMGFIHLTWSIISVFTRLGWPLVLLLTGLGMHLSFFSGRNADAGILVPGGILTTYGLLFLLNTLFGWWVMTALWPVFILGVAIGLFELYLFGNREKGLLIPVSILGGIAIIFLSFTIGGFIHTKIKEFIIPAVLVIIGVIIVLKNYRGSGKDF